MSLVDGEKIDFGVSEHRDHIVAHQPLRRDVKQAQRTIAQGFDDALTLIAVRRRIQRRRRHAELAQLRDLVAHRRNQRRDHEREPFARHRQQLIAEGFAAACRHDRKNVLPAQRRADDLLLSRTKSGKAEHAAKLAARLIQKRFSVRHARAPLAGSKTGVH